MRAIDTNVLVRLIARDDPAQIRLAEAFVAKGAWVSLLVLAETVWVLTAVYALDRKKIAKALNILLEQDTLAFQDAEIAANALALFKTHKGVAFSDCLILEIAAKAGHGPVGTFYRDFAKVRGVERL
jgi:predicted nucleic-acid-binding protein